MRNAVEDKFMAGIALYAGYDVLHFGDRLLAVPTETLQGIPFRGASQTRPPLHARWLDMRGQCAGFQDRQPEAEQLFLSGLAGPVGRMRHSEGSWQMSGATNATRRVLRGHCDVGPHCPRLLIDHPHTGPLSPISAARERGDRHLLSPSIWFEASGGEANGAGVAAGPIWQSVPQAVRA